MLWSEMLQLVKRYEIISEILKSVTLHNFF
jgi:hypothetical protein